MAMSEGRFIEHDVAAICLFSIAEVPPTTRCRHRRGKCERCATTDRRDVEHTTANGRGAVAALRERKGGGR